jgi:acetyl-CoA carboxylase carboxyl transferase beta subunit
MAGPPSPGPPDLLFDSFETTHEDVTGRDPIRWEGYHDAVAAALVGSPSEAVVTGIAKVGEAECSAAVFDFGFMGGSMGEVVGAKVCAAMRDAAGRKIPFLAVTSSGGARMQEGMAALAQMPRTIAASADLSRRGIPRIAILRHPTTGGVYASFASLSDLIVAEEGATIGFAGPRVVAAMTGHDLPAGSHTAEAAMGAGLVDAVLPLDEMRGWLQDTLAILSLRGTSAAPHGTLGIARREGLPVGEAWAEFQLARQSDRPPPRFYVQQLSPKLVELHGDRMGSDDPAILAAIGDVDGRCVAFVALDRSRPAAAGFRKATRSIELESRLGIPMITLVDTPGADPSYESEYAGLANAIANTFRALLEAPVPVMSIVTGEGGSGGALALACGDVVAIQQHAVFSVIAPEGAASILKVPASDIATVASSLRPTSRDVFDLGMADAVIEEPGRDMNDDPTAPASRLVEWVRATLPSLQADVAARAARFERLNELPPE